MKNEHFVYSLMGLFFITAVLGLSLSVGEVQGENSNAIFDKNDNESCCVCFSEGCCIDIAGKHCDDEGNLSHGPLIEAFLGLFGADLGNVCSLCDTCDENEFTDAEDSQFLDVCDICVLEESKIDELECVPGDGDGDADGGNDGGIPVDELDLSGGSCSLRIRN